LDGLSKEQLLALAKRWRIEPVASSMLLKSVSKNRHVRSEEAVAIGALSLIPNQLTGDEGWSAVRTLVHGGRVLGTLGDLSTQEVAELWAPLEPVIPLSSLSHVEEPMPAAERGRSAVNSAIKTIPSPPRARAAPASAAKAPAPYGPNHAEVAAFINGVSELSAIQWLRVLDRRKLVASVTREGAAEPAGVVRSILAMLDGTRDLDNYLRCRAFVAVERASFALESHHHTNLDQIRPVLVPSEPSLALEGLNGGRVATKVPSLERVRCSGG